MKGISTAFAWRSTAFGALTLAAPLLVGLLGFTGLSCSNGDHEPFVEPTAGDRLAVLSVRDLPLLEATDLRPQRETLVKVRYEDGKSALQYEFAADGLHVYSAIHEDVTVAHAQHTLEVLLGEQGRELSARDDLLQWGDASSLRAQAPDSWDCVGRRGTRVVWAAWGGTAYEPSNAEDLVAFLAASVERMARHEL